MSSVSLTCSCQFDAKVLSIYDLLSNDTIFLDITLGWYYNILGWKFVMIFYWKKENLLWTYKKFVYIIFIPKYHPEIFYRRTWLSFIGQILHIKSTQYKKLAQNALRFTYVNSLINVTWFWGKVVLTKNCVK